MLVDAGNNVFVCGWSSHNIQVITANGRKYETLLSSSDGLQRSYSVAYRDIDDTFVVGCRDQDKVH